jgi:hypothetical protein
MWKKVLAAGIFIVENLNHAIRFADEVNTLVGPAVSPLPETVALVIHALTVGLGISGSVMFVLGDSKLGRKGLGALAIFMVLITWSWWFRRFGEFVWEVADNEDRRMRTIHCLKNLSIFGFILCLGGALGSSRDKRKET